MEYYPGTEPEAMELGHDYGEIIMLTDFDSPVDNDIQMNETSEENIEYITTELGSIHIANDKRKKNKYGAENIRRFIEILQEEGVSVPVAAKRCMIPRSSAYKLFAEFNSGDGTVLPAGPSKKKGNRGTAKKLLPEHTKFLVLYFDEHSSSTLEMAQDALVSQFEGFTISLPALWKHLTEKCFFTLKQASLYNRERDADRTLRLRHEIVSKWKEIGVDFQKNCVFIDEAGFNTQMMRGRAWSRVGEPAKVTVHSKKGVNVSIIGCISPFGTINFSKVEPLQQSDVDKLEKEFQYSQPSKKRKAKDDSKKKPKKGTTAYHIVKFVQAVMDVLDKHGKNGFYIVMDNCKIHHTAFVVEAINSRGYKPLFMPPYSPFLNPIEECWAKIKGNIKRSPLDENSTLTPRIAEACKTVSADNCLGWIRHSESYWGKCIDKVKGLK